MNWGSASRRRTVAFALMSALGLWLLTRDQRPAPLPGDGALRGGATSGATQERHPPHAVTIDGAVDDLEPARKEVGLEVTAPDVAAAPEGPPEPTAPPEDDRVSPIYTFWDDSGGPPMLDDELTLTLVERADGAAFEPWSVVVDLRAVRDMQPEHSVAMPLPAPGLYRATCRDGRYHPTDVWVPDIDHPRVAIVLEPADSAGADR